MIVDVEFLGGFQFQTNRANLFGLRVALVASDPNPAVALLAQPAPPHIFWPGARPRIF